MTSRFDTDQFLQLILRGFIQMTALKYARSRQRQPWQPGQRLKLLLVGYNGSRNTGADVRVAEIVRQFYHLMGAANVELTLVTFDTAASIDYFPGVRQVQLPLPLFPKFLYDECPQHHGVVTCEGSMFKSKFTDILTALSVGALGMAAAENKVSVGYGAEAGHMRASLRQFVQKHCQDSLIICRNEASRAVLAELDITTTGGTDTAWTFDPGPPEKGAAWLRKVGWDGKRPIVVVCPINPFWWPVRPSWRKLLERYTLGKHKAYQHYLHYFHHHSAQASGQYQAYLDGLAQAVRHFRQEQGVFPVLIGMDKLDHRACQELAARFSPALPYFMSHTYHKQDIVNILQQASLVVSSRFHAIVTSMPAQVVSIGVSMDERIHNLMIERGHESLLLTVDEVHLGDKLLAAMRYAMQEQARLSAEIGRFVPRQLRLMGQMGRDFMTEVQRVYPAFPHLAPQQSWEAYLPPLPPPIIRLLEQYT